MILGSVVPDLRQANEYICLLEIIEQKNVLKLEINKFIPVQMHALYNFREERCIAAHVHVVLLIINQSQTLYELLI